MTNTRVTCAAQVAAQPAQAVAYAMDTRNARRWNLRECATRLLARNPADSAAVLFGVAVQAPPKVPTVSLRARDVPVNQHRGGRPSNAGAPTTDHAGYGCVRAWMRGLAGLLIVSERETISAEIELIERAKVEAEAFGILYDRYVRTVFAFAFSKVRDQAQAEDLTSQTFLQALKALPRYQQRGLPFRSWLLRITANLITDQHRAAAPTQSLQERPRGLGDTEDDAPSYDPRSACSGVDRRVGRGRRLREIDRRPYRGAAGCIETALCRSAGHRRNRRAIASHRGFGQDAASARTAAIAAQRGTGLLRYPRHWDFRSCGARSAEGRCAVTSGPIPDRDPPPAEAQLADALASILAGDPLADVDAGAPEPQFDPAELAELAMLGRALQDRGTQFALLDQAHAAFDGVFSDRLRQTLLAAHAGAGAPAAAALRPASSGTSPALRGEQSGAVAPVVPPQPTESPLEGLSGSTAPFAERVKLDGPSRTLETLFRLGRRRLSLAAMLAAALLVALAVAVQGALRQPVYNGALSTHRATATTFGPFAQARLVTPRATTVPPQPQLLQGKGFAPNAPTPVTVPPSPAPMRVYGAQASTPRPAPQSMAPLRLRLSVPAPALPATAPLYAVLNPPFTPRAIAAIVASFPGMVVSPSPGGIGVQTFVRGSERLKIVTASGRVQYSHALVAGTVHAALSRAEAIAAATAWLRQHDLYPQRVDVTQTVLIQNARGAQVRFVPALPVTAPKGAVVAAATPQQIPSWLVVQLDPYGQVIGATVAWPQIVQVSHPHLIDIHTLAAPSGAPYAQPGVRITSIQLVYEQRFSPARAVNLLVPTYRLKGSIAAKGGALRPYLALVPAVPGT